jgi:hypothetical protein
LSEEIAAACCQPSSERRIAQPTVAGNPSEGCLGARRTLFLSTWSALKTRAWRQRVKMRDLREEPQSGVKKAAMPSPIFEDSPSQNEKLVLMTMDWNMDIRQGHRSELCAEGGRGKGMATAERPRRLLGHYTLQASTLTQLHTALGQQWPPLPPAQ